MNQYLQVPVVLFVTLVVYYIVRAWSRSLVLGIVGIGLVTLPIGFAYLSDRLTLLEALSPVIGVILLSADLCGRLPRWGLFKRHRVGKS